MSEKSDHFNNSPNLFERDGLKVHQAKNPTATPWGHSKKRTPRRGKNHYLLCFYTFGAKK